MTICNSDDNDATVMIMMVGNCDSDIGDCRIGGSGDSGGSGGW